MDSEIAETIMTETPILTVMDTEKEETIKIETTTMKEGITYRAKITKDGDTQLSTIAEITGTEIISTARDILIAKTIRSDRGTENEWDTASGRDTGILTTGSDTGITEITDTKTIITVLTA